MKSFLLLVVCVLITCPAFSQEEAGQTVNGIVRHATTRHGLQGASVVLTGTDVNEGTVTGDDGRFALENIPPGRYRLQVSFTGFARFEDEVAVIAGRPTVVNVNLEESSFILSEVTLESGREHFEPTLESISIEKALRIPANFFDPVRMATSYPTVVAASDQANSVVVKGNSPTGVLYRLNGMDIVNPNHLSNAGTIYDKPVVSGGGTNILSAQMLDRTDFYAGAFPASYGNALGGAFDMLLRDGNPERGQYTAQASLIGLDVAAEGPFSKASRSSYLVNYRYSTIGLLSKLGVQFGDEDIGFQDLSFNVSFPFRNEGHLNVFGLGGLSKNDFEAKDLEDIEEDKDFYNIDYDAKTAAAGFSYTVPVLENGSLFLGATYSVSDQERELERGAGTPEAILTLNDDRFSHKRDLVSAHLSYSVKASDKVDLKIGTLVNYSVDDLSIDRNFNFHPGGAPLVKDINGMLYQPYAEGTAGIGNSVVVNAGLRYVHFTYNGTNQLEPRVSVNVSSGKKSAVNVTYRLVSQTQVPFLYMLDGNKNLDLTKAHHGEVAYRYHFDRSVLKTELYYQQLYDVPVSMWFSALNLTEIDNQFFYVFAPGISTLRNAGEGTNRGINVVYEKPMYGNQYVLLGGSLYESTYTDEQGLERATRFSGNYSFTGTYGREWRKKEKNRTIGINTRIIYHGGMRESSPATTSPVISAGEPYYDNSDPYNVKLDDYFRIDLRVSFRKDKPGYTRTFAVDIQNLSANENEWYHYYDYSQQKIVTKYHLGIIPVLVYRIDF